MARRRFIEYLKILEECYNSRLPNYRLMSIIFGHLMRHVMVTPSQREPELRHALRELRFEEVMMSFGIFFVDLSPRTLASQYIQREDPHILAIAHKTPFHNTVKSKYKIQDSTLIPRIASGAYPWGAHLGISKLNELLLENSDQFLRDPILLTEDDMRHPDSAQIFRSFSSDIWLLADEYLSGARNDQYPTLSGAMESWTTQGIQRRCHEIILLPTFDQLQVTGKLSQRQFSGKRSFFFPPEDALGSHPCKGFTVTDNTYLSIYYRSLKAGSSDSRIRLNSDLDSILEALQCLPACHKERGKQVIWRVSNGRLQFETNSAYYPITGVSAERTQVTRRAQVGAATLKKKLYGRK